MAKKHKFFTKYFDLSRISSYICFIIVSAMDKNTTLADLERLKQSFLEKAALVDQTIMLFKSSPQSDINGNSFLEEEEHSPSPINVKYSSFKSRYSYKQKIATILTAENRFLSVKEITDIIILLQPQLKLDEVKKAVGSAKSYMLKEKAIVKYVVGASNANSFYGSKNWLDESGHPMPEHMYDEALVNTKENIEI